MRNKYLKLLEKFLIEPNFWCSEEYFQKSDLKEVDSWGTIGIFDEKNLVFPPVHIDKGILWTEYFPNEIWADFVGFNSDSRNSSYKFLDYEYLYDPNDFSKMAGKKWMVFRKNSRKFPSRLGKELFYHSDNLEGYEDKILVLFIDWLSHMDEDTTIHDDKVMKEFLLYGENRKILVDEKGELYGLNVWDENYLYVNFRYSLCGNYSFLNEYMRRLFYLDMIPKGKLVNDGGVLDNPKLKFFKDKLNPIRIREVKSWERKGR